MIEGLSPLWQTVLGTGFTWGVTALGSALVFVLPSGQTCILDVSLGFAAGVMLSASFWSLLAPALDIVHSSGVYGQFSFLPLDVGLFAGALFVMAADLVMTRLGVHSPVDYLVRLEERRRHCSSNGLVSAGFNRSGSHSDAEEGSVSPDINASELRLRRPLVGAFTDGKSPSVIGSPHDDVIGSSSSRDVTRERWRRILLLVIAITVHNIPEGMAVGVAFGAAERTPDASFAKARNLALGIGIQNFPEGLAVSLPLHGSGLSLWKSFWYGQLSGMVEPVAGILGAVMVSVMEPLLPYALSFAAGAMIYVVIDDIIPEAHSRGNGRISSWSAVAGFILMTTLDVGLG